MWENPCQNCYQDKPTEGILAVNLSTGSQNKLLEVRIIRGRLENGMEYLRDSINTHYKEYWVEVGSYYTVEAHYLVDGKHYKVVDGDRVTVYLEVHA